MKNEEKKEPVEEKCLNQEDKDSSGEEEVQEKPQRKRQIIIETDGTNIEIVKAEVSNLELQAILNNLLRQITSR